MYILICLMDDEVKVFQEMVQENATAEDFQTVCDAITNNMDKPDKIIVDVWGGVTYCDDSRVEIIDHDDR